MLFFFSDCLNWAAFLLIQILIYTYIYFFPESCRDFWTGSGAETVSVMWTGESEETQLPL